MAIFYDMVEDFVEVFMDDFSIFSNSLEVCLQNLGKVLTHYKEKNLVLVWRSAMVREGVVLGHKKSQKGLEVDRAKIEVMEKLLPPVSVKGVQFSLAYRILHVIY